MNTWSNLKELTHFYGANLYIDESNDWNDNNPWNVPVEFVTSLNKGVATTATEYEQYGEFGFSTATGENDNSEIKWYLANEWNHNMNGDASNGKQVISIPAWTRYYNSSSGYFNLDDCIMSGNVAYTTGGADTPFRFVKELNEQKSVLNSTLENRWTKTSAPDNDWTQYEDEEIVGSNYPYRPNYSAKRKYVDHDYNANHYANAATYVRQSSGVDCSGYIQRVASYTENDYVLTDLTTDDTWTTSGSVSHLEGVGKIEDNGTISGILGDSTLIDNEKCLIPGDILHMDGHVVVILKIKSNSHRGVTDKNVTVIEAAGSGGNWRNSNTRTWFDLKEDLYQNITFRRMENN